MSSKSSFSSISLLLWKVAVIRPRFDDERCCLTFRWSLLSFIAYSKLQFLVACRMRSRIGGFLRYGDVRGSSRQLQTYLLLLLRWLRAAFLTMVQCGCEIRWFCYCTLVS